MLKRILHSIDAFSSWVGYITSTLIFAMLAVLLYEICARYLFHAPTIWAHETSAFIFGAYFMLASAYVLCIRGHVSINIFYDRLSVRMQAILDLVTFIFFLLMCITLIWHGGRVALDAWRMGETSQSVWGPPLYPIRTLIPIGAIILLIQGIAKFVRDLNIAITGKNNNARH